MNDIEPQGISMENVLEEVQGKESKKTIDKRKLLALAATAAAGLVITPLIGGAHADTGASGSGQPLMVGEGNEATDGNETVLNTHTTDQHAGFKVNNDGDTGEAIHGEDFSTSFGGVGIHGRSPNIALVGECTGTYTCTGGYTKNGVAVLGISSAVQGAGVRGSADTGAGVEGHSMYGTGVFADSEYGVALQVVGKSGIQGKVDGGTQEGSAILTVRNEGSPGATPTQGELSGWPISIGAACPNGIGILAFGPQFGVYGTTDPGGPGTSVGTGVIGMTDKGTGVLGQSNSGTGVKATSMTGTALQVVGTSTISCDTNSPTTAALMVENSGLGISATSTSNFGLESCSPVLSVVGLAINPKTTSPSQALKDWYTDPNRGSVGLLGYTQDGKGVVGFADTGIGVLAISKGSPALRVEGKSSFSTVGSSDISSDKQQVKNPLVTSKSHITVTLMDKNPGKVAVSWVERTPGKGFTVHLTDKVQQKVPFTYFIVEP